MPCPVPCRGFDSGTGADPLLDPLLGRVFLPRPFMGEGWGEGGSKGGGVFAVDSWLAL